MILNIKQFTMIPNIKKIKHGENMGKPNIYLILVALFIVHKIVFPTDLAHSCCSPIFPQPQFIPNISLIADSSFVVRNLKDSEYERLGIPGFIHELVHNGEGHGHGLMNLRRGFNFNYAELDIASVVDPYFNLVGNFLLAGGSFEVHEVYFTTRSFPYNFQIKGGKFLSSIGRINSQHQHVWDFADIPLVYKVFFEEISEKGIQVTWLAPTPFYLIFGAEILQGENELSFGRKEIRYNEKLIFEEAPTPNLYTGFIKTSYDIGNITFLIGFSFLTGKTRKVEDHEGKLEAFGGNTNILGADIYTKYFIDSYRYISLQGEYFFRNQEGKIYESESESYSPFTKKQSGFYLQTVFGITKRWRIGGRYDLILNGSNAQDHSHTNGHSHTNEQKDLSRYSFMIDFIPSDFSRIRLQYNHDRSKFVDGERKILNEIILEFNLAIGAHGAHMF